MNKLTPMILALLMLASTSLVALDWAELEKEQQMETEGRAGPDADIVSIIAPMATTTDAITGETRNALRAGDDVNFDIYIANSGDADITELSVSVTVYLAEGGSRAMIAKDAAGNDLAWTNGDVVCDDTFVCPFTTLAPGATLSNGKYRMNYQGSNVVWTPITGDYIVEVTVDALDDSNIDNDAYEIPVQVSDWQDLVLDLSWDSGKEVESGSDQKAFTLDISTDGSVEWSARNVTVTLEVSGLLETATDTGGNDILGTTTLSDFGNYSEVETFRHEVEENNFTEEFRYVLDFGESAQWTGFVDPDTTSESGDYSIKVNLVSYVMYGAFPDCEEVVQDRNDPNLTATYVHTCEVYKTQDDDASTSEDEIMGKIQTYHDIGITNLVVNQGYVGDEDELNGTFTIISGPSLPGLVDGPLNPTWSKVQASVEHMGSDISNTYDWVVSFEIENTITGDVHSEDADSCTNGAGEDYMHKELGMDMMDPMAAETLGEACILYDFAPGIYNITAELSMVNTSVADMSGRNDKSEIYEISALNNRPTVTLTLENTEDIVLGQDTINIAADAYDADDDEGNNLNYVWTHPGMLLDEDGTPLPSECNGEGMGFANCVLVAGEQAYAGIQTYGVTVTDEFGSSSTAYINVFVWNAAQATATSGNVEMMYDLVYNGANVFTFTLAGGADTSVTKDLSDFGYAGEYTSVAVLDYDPLTRYLGSDLYSQSINITYDTSELEPTSIFWVSPNNIWIELDGTFSESSTSGIIEIDPGLDVLSKGQIVMMGGELQIIEAPTASPTGLLVQASKGGDISASWGYSGSTVPGFDWLEVEVCDSADNCDTEMVNVSSTTSSMSGQTDTVHGETYTYTLQIYNAGGCNPTIATGSATADKMVDGDAKATAMSVSNKDDSTWNVMWKVDGDASDVEGWKVCWSDFAWTIAGDMPTQCTDAGAATGTDVSADIMKPGGATKKYHFTAVPYDDKGNMKNDVSMTDITLTIDNTQVDPCEVDPDSEGCQTIGTDGAEGSEVPTWTWGVIVGLVVVSFVAGAFILSRGGGGEGDKDWDY